MVAVKYANGACRDVTLSDAAGAAVDTSGSLIPFQPVVGEDSVFTFTVTGRAAEAQ